ncbi:MAG: hypothetical protein WD009_11300 [Phycisphaeraceae bacterium]
MIRMRCRAGLVGGLVATIALFAGGPAGVLAQGGAPPARIAAAMEQVPRSAPIIFIVPDMAVLSEAVAAFRDATTLPVDEMRDLLGELKREVGVEQGLDDDGTFMVVVDGIVEAIEQEAEPWVLVFVPVTDYDAFVGNFGGDGGEAITAIALPKQTYARQFNGHALLAETREQLEAFDPNDVGVAMQALGDAGDRALGAAEAFIYIDVAAIAPAVLNTLDAWEREMAEMNQQPGMMAGELTMMFELWDAAGREIVETVLTGVRSLLLTLDIGEEGATVDQVTGVVQGSELAGFLQPGESTAKAELDRLPDQPWLFAMAMDTRVIDMERIGQTVLDLLPDDRAELPAEMAWMATLIEPAMQLMQRTDAAASVLYVPDMMRAMTGDFISQVQVARVDDPQAYLRDYRAMLDMMDGLEFPAGPGMPGGEPRQMRFDVTYQQAVFEIDGAAVDEMSIDVAMPGGDPMQAQMMGAMRSAGYVAARGDRIVGTAGLDRNLMRQALGLADAGGGLGTLAHIEGVRERGLPGNAAVEAYVSFQGVAGLFNEFAMMMGGGPALEIDPDIPPVVFGAAVEPDIVTQRIYVPSEVVRASVELFDAMDAMRPQPAPRGPGGPGGGGGGGPMPPPF